MQSREWSQKNQYNGFNSWKGLFYADWYRKIVKGEIPPPVEASLDPICACNLRCQHCNTGKYLDSGHKMTDDHLIELIDFLGEWGVKAICFGGGGEPTLHEFLPKAIAYTHSRGMATGIATNGVHITNEFIQSTSYFSSWVSVSVDAATPETFKLLKGKDCFEKVITNIERMASINVNKAKRYWDLCFRFLISPLNQDEILDACELARKSGALSFHARIADLGHQGMKSTVEGEFDIPLIMKQMEACRSLETDDFRVFTVTHKFDPDLVPRKHFKQCYGAPLTIQLCADGGVYFCVDQRFRDEYKLCDHFPDPDEIEKVWGSEKHKELIFGNTPDKCSCRCTFGKYCEQAEQLFANGNEDKDPMCWRFP